MKQIANEWLNSARDDLSVIDRIIADEHLTNMVAFHSQQCIEKCFKAIIEELDLQFIKTHDLIKLHNIVKKDIEIADIDSLIILADLYTDARYPITIGLLPDGKPSKIQAKGFYNFATLVFDLTCKKLKS
jgi:HEPN domain-containing protein